MITGHNAKLEYIQTPIIALISYLVTGSDAVLENTYNEKNYNV